MSDPLHLFQGFGIEIEYMIVDRETLDVLPVADEALRAAAGDYVDEVEMGDIAWSNELVLHQIELKTNGPMPALEGLPAAFQASLAQMQALLQPLGARLMPTGMHPWMDPLSETRLWPHDYGVVYQAFDRVFDCRRHGWANLQAVHLNLPFADAISIQDGEFARLHAAVRVLLPILPALAASSPVMDERLTGRLDNRMEVYRTNAAKIPAVIGKVIPEPVYSQADYQSAILEPMYREIAREDPEGLLQHEWLNARGAIARFDRSAIEIRMLDTQECPRADHAVCAAVVAVLKALVEERWSSLAEQQALAVEPLAEILLATVRDGELAAIPDVPYLALFGLTASPKCTARELWQHLLGEASPVNDEWIEPLEIILDRGPLARRIMRALDWDLSRRRLTEVYRELCDCLSEGRMFLGPH